MSPNCGNDYVTISAVSSGGEIQEYIRACGCLPLVTFAPGYNKIRVHFKASHHENLGGWQYYYNRKGKVTMATSYSYTAAVYVFWSMTLIKSRSETECEIMLTTHLHVDITARHMSVTASRSAGKSAVCLKPTRKHQSAALLSLCVGHPSIDISSSIRVFDPHQGAGSISKMAVGTGSISSKILVDRKLLLLFHEGYSHITISKTYHYFVPSARHHSRPVRGWLSLSQESRLPMYQQQTSYPWPGILW